jgi:hypothetical protein
LSKEEEEQTKNKQIRFFPDSHGGFKCYGAGKTNEGISLGG